MTEKTWYYRDKVPAVGVSVPARPTTDILSDLITELRRYRRDDRLSGLDLWLLADRVEARMKEDK